jgi:hypothetical protein
MGACDRNIQCGATGKCLVECVDGACAPDITTVSCGAGECSLRCPMGNSKGGTLENQAESCEVVENDNCDNG